MQAFPGSPITFPAIGAASAGVRVPPTRIRSGDSTRPLVGSNSTQPRPGRKASHQAWVAPAPRRVAMRRIEVAGDEHRRAAQPPDGLDHQPGEVAAGAGPALATSALATGCLHPRARAYSKSVVDGGLMRLSTSSTGSSGRAQMFAQPGDEAILRVVRRGRDQRRQHQPVGLRVDQRKDALRVVRLESVPAARGSGRWSDG